MATIELDPEYPLFWRDETVAQLGTSPCHIVLDDPRTWQLELLSILKVGIPRGNIASAAEAFGATARETSDFLAHIAPALRERRTPRAVSLLATNGVPHDVVLGAIDGLESAGFVVSRATTEDALASRDRLAVVLSPGVVPPHVAARLVANDVPHIPIAFMTRRVSVGPHIVPGSTACLSCIWEHEKRRDAAWPAIAAQLITHATEHPPGRAIATHASALISRIAGSPEHGVSRSVTISADGRRRWRSHRPEATCLCRSPEGNAMGIVRIVPRLETTTHAAIAQHG
ncbi:hypothetical protein JOF34_002367 [Microbacterium amylolyticum]|uniref:Bacteriocin biosynthesis cyclodehydratase domain-containing protein n=1 Tax=Microbacterium amylolyticum TaxID=936337 RepID=A0ABS4ZKH0_9MICO|nr:hypothetical protein [Microbacterium amylolyticum]